MLRKLTAVLFLCICQHKASGQQWDLGKTIGDFISSESDGKFKLSFETRGRYEQRLGNAFGKDPDLETGLIRNRVGLTYKPASWIKISGMMQDSRAPWYGNNAPSSVRDEAQLHEAYIELFGDTKRGWTFSAGRQQLNLGDARVIGTPQWGNLGRTYDFARTGFKLPKAKMEFIFVSPVKIRLDDFNKPVLGERAWGTYNVFPNLIWGISTDAYILRHEQNATAGFVGGSRILGTNKLGVTSYGLRPTLPIPWGLKWTNEMILQTGKVGLATHRAAAWASTITRRWTIVKRTFDQSVEYKFASGTHNPKDLTRSATYDQVFAANHDKFGHADLFGWRNLHHARTLSTFGLTKAFSMNFMYNNYLLASKLDGLYNSSGKVISRSANGQAGRHVGQETDFFVTYKFKNLQTGGGYGQFYKGEFVKATTPGVNSRYLYLFHTYSF